MSRFTTGRVFAFAALIFLLTAHPMSAQEETGWTWEDRDGESRTRDDLLLMLKKHRTWVESKGKSGTRADLSEAVLAGADLKGAVLESADLHRADLTGANLSGVNLKSASLDGAILHAVHFGHADLNGAYLSEADLTDASLISAQMGKAVLVGADLRHAVLRETNLSGANLRGAHLNDVEVREVNLTSADLDGAELAGAHMDRVNLMGATLTSADLSHAVIERVDLKGSELEAGDLEGAVFEPTSLPEVRTIASAKTLELLTYEDNPSALVQLRKLFADGGFREQERKITYALKRREAELSWEGCKSRKTGDKTRAILWSSDSNLANCASFILNRVFFDWTCQYGKSPGRPLSLGVLLWLLCSVLYSVCIHALGKTGLYRVYAPSLQENSSVPQRVEKILPAEMKASGARRFLEFSRREWVVFRASMFFSLMSAFNIGFRDINFGRWLRLLTRQKFDMEAVGWARVVAGWQSLVSVYFIALWVLTYFGRPFG